MPASTSALSADGQATPEAAAPRRLKTTTNVFYGVGSIAYGLKLQALGSLLLLFFNQVVGLPSTTVGLVLMAALVLDAIFDPLIGQWSDNFRSRWGRRHPFMYFSALPAALAFYFLWQPPVGWSDAALTAYLTVFLISLRLVITFYETPSTALAPELAPDYNARTRLLSYRHLFQSIGGLAMTVLTYVVLLRPTPEQPNGILNRDGYEQYGLIGAVVIFLSIIVSTAGTHSEIPHLTRPPARRLGLKAMVGEMAATLSNRNFLVMTLSVLIAAISMGVIGALGLYINAYFWELPTQAIAMVVGVGLISTVVGVAAGPPLTARFGKKHTALGVFALTLVVSTWPLAAGLAGLTPPPGSPELVALLVANNAVAGAFGTIGGIAVVSMLADVVEESQVQTGRRSEGLLMSADNLIQKSIAGFGIFLSGLLLSLIGFPQHAVPGEVDPEVVRRLIYFYLPVVFVLSTFSVASLSFYRIDKKGHEENLRQIAEAPLLDDAPASPVAQETPEDLPRPV